MIFTCLHVILKNETEEFFENKIINTEVEFDEIPLESMISYSKSEHFLYFKKFLMFHLIFLNKE